jgi:hypothetical protein
MQRNLSPLRFVWKREREPGGGTGLPRLKLQHALLRTARLPAPIKVAEKATRLSIDAAGEPRVRNIQTEMLQHLSRDLVALGSGKSGRQMR